MLQRCFHYTSVDFCKWVGSRDFCDCISLSNHNFPLLKIVEFFNISYRYFIRFVDFSIKHRDAEVWIRSGDAGVACEPRWCIVLQNNRYRFYDSLGVTLFLHNFLKSVDFENPSSQAATTPFKLHRVIPSSLLTMSISVYTPSASSDDDISLPPLYALSTGGTPSSATLCIIR